jgi:hypothetical protein
MPRSSWTHLQEEEASIKTREAVQLESKQWQSDMESHIGVAYLGLANPLCRTRGQLAK